MVDLFCWYIICDPLLVHLPSGDFVHATTGSAGTNTSYTYVLRVVLATPISFCLALWYQLVEPSFGGRIIMLKFYPADVTPTGGTVGLSVLSIEY